MTVQSVREAAIELSQLSSRCHLPYTESGHVGRFEATETKSIAAPVNVSSESNQPAVRRERPAPEVDPEFAFRRRGTGLAELADDVARGRVDDHDRLVFLHHCG